MCKPVRILPFLFVKTPFQFPVRKEVRFMVCALETTSLILTESLTFVPRYPKFYDMALLTGGRDRFSLALPIFRATTFGRTLSEDWSGHFD